MITVNQGDDSKMYEYLSEIMVKKHPRFEIIYSLHCFLFFMCLPYSKKCIKSSYLKGTK